METWLNPNWEKMFVLTYSPVELVLRVVIIYVTVCLLFRIILLRQTGRSTLQDMLVVVLVVGVCRNPLVADAYSITDCLIVVGTILVTSYLIDWLNYHCHWIHRVFHSAPVPLIRDSLVLKDNLHRELMTEARLTSQLREHGLDDPGRVKEAYLEGTGNVSVIPKKQEEDGGVKARDPTAGRSGKWRSSWPKWTN
jgi:uncharacterized membrane protein YcaP (DUF421 family)